MHEIICLLASSSGLPPVIFPRSLPSSTVRSVLLLILCFFFFRVRALAKTASTGNCGLVVQCAPKEPGKPKRSHLPDTPRFIKGARNMKLVVDTGYDDVKS
jgi:hypothetical protein